MFLYSKIAKNFRCRRTKTTVIVNEEQTLVQVFSCEFCEISKNAYFIEKLRATDFEASIVTPIIVTISSKLAPSIKEF